MSGTTSGLSRVYISGNTSFTGFKHRVNDVLQGKCFIYIAKGEFLPADIPATKSALANLISGTNNPFLPLGDMDATGSNITWSEKTIDVDFGAIGSGYDIAGTFVSITVNRNMFRFVSELGHRRYSFLFIPEGTDDVFFAVSGVNVTTDGNLGVVEDGLSKITFKVSRKANKITDVIKFAKLSMQANEHEEDDSQHNQT